MTTARTISPTGTLSRTTAASTRSPAPISNSRVEGCSSGTTSPFSSIFLVTSSAYRPGGRSTCHVAAIERATAERSAPSTRFSSARTGYPTGTPASRSDDLR